MKKEPFYRCITWTDRLKIEALYSAGHSFRFIAKELDFVHSAIHHEVQHGLYEHLDGKNYLYVKKYSGVIAQEHADQQATSKGVPIKLGKRYDYANYVAERIKVGNSPDVIVHTLKQEDKWTVSVTTLNRYIEQGYIPDIISKDLLENHNRKPSKKNKEKKTAARAPKGTSIERRPPEIAAREKFGT